MVTRSPEFIYRWLLISANFALLLKPYFPSIRCCRRKFCSCLLVNMGFRIRVRVVSGETLKVNLPDNCTLAGLKEAVVLALGLPVSEAQAVRVSLNKKVMLFEVFDVFMAAISELSDVHGMIQFNVGFADMHVHVFSAE